MKELIRPVPIEIVDLGIETHAQIEIEEILLTSFPPIQKTILKFITDFTVPRFGNYSIKIKNDDAVIKCYVGNTLGTFIQKDAGERTVAEWHKVICDSEVHNKNNPLTCYINPPYPETKLDKTIKRINESQKFDSVFKIDFDEFFERHTRMELAHIAHEIINYLEKPDEHKTD